MFSSEYGWTTKEILEISLWELKWRLDTIIKRSNLNRNFEMSIHGVSPAGNEAKQADVKLDDNQKKAMQIALLQAKERKRKEFIKRG